MEYKIKLIKVLWNLLGEVKNNK